MAIIDWRIQGHELAACNCDWGCPCQFNALPSRGHCRAAVAIRVDTGHFGDTPLDGLGFGGLFAWPKAIHEGHGEAQPIVDERASEAQRAAILTIMSGKESEPGANFFNIFAAMLETVHPPLFRAIEFDLDLKKATGRFYVRDLIDARAEPIRNPVTGAQHRVKVSLAEGFEYLDAEFASSSARSRNSPIELEWDQRHAHLCKLDLTGHGLIRE